jgi:glycine/sarcosine/betaine reductase complex component A
MDLDGQQRVLEAIEKHGAENLVVVLGAPDAAGAEIFSITLIDGDPTYAGPLAGVSLKLPVYHVLESEIKEQVDPDVYQSQVGVMELALDADQITATMERVRSESL